jgi:hypothetical protein
MSKLAKVPTFSECWDYYKDPWSPEALKASQEKWNAICRTCPQGTPKEWRTHSWDIDCLDINNCENKEHYEISHGYQIVIPPLEEFDYDLTVDEVTDLTGRPVSPILEPGNKM